MLVQPPHPPAPPAGGAARPETAPPLPPSVSLSVSSPSPMFLTAQAGVWHSPTKTKQRFQGQTRGKEGRRREAGGTLPLPAPGKANAASASKCPGPACPGVPLSSRAAMGKPRNCARRAAGIKGRGQPRRHGARGALQTQSRSCETRLLQREPHRGSRAERQPATPAAQESSAPGSAPNRTHPAPQHLDTQVCAVTDGTAIRRRSSAAALPQPSPVTHPGPAAATHPPARRSPGL